MRTTWQQHKERGSQYFHDGLYDRALESYLAALGEEEEEDEEFSSEDEEEVRVGDVAQEQSSSSSSPLSQKPTPSESQILLSNIVACRLKLSQQNNDQSQKAIRDSKRCIALDPSWPKGHVRLASSILSLPPGDEGRNVNEACCELQTALRLDGGYNEARRMLVRELRGIGGAVEEEEDGDQRPNASSWTNVPPFSPDPTSGSASTAPRSSSTSSPSYNDIDDTHTPTITDRMTEILHRMKSSFENMNDDMKSVMGFCCLLLILYVTFGGRFGFESSPSPSPSQYGYECQQPGQQYGYCQQQHNNNGYKQRSGSGSSSMTRGNYEAGNAYDLYYQNKRGASSATNVGRRTSTEYYDDTSSTKYSHYTKDYYQNHGRSHSDSSSDDMSFYLYFGLMMIVIYGCHFIGISPWNALFFMNILGGGRVGMYGGGWRRQGGPFRMRYGGFGWGRGMMGRGRFRRGRW